MRKKLQKRYEPYRITTGRMGSYPGSLFGAFQIPGPSGDTLSVIASDGEGWKEMGLPGQPWEHVSVSLPDRCPSWEEMCFVKNIFWKSTEWVLQYHPAGESYVNENKHCLHLWRPKRGSIPKPPIECV